MKTTPNKKLSMRIFYKKSLSKTLNEFFGKHLDDIDTIHIGVDAIEPNASKIIIFDGITEDGIYHNQMEFGIDSFKKIHLRQEIKVNISGNELDWLVKTSNS